LGKFKIFITEFTGTCTVLHIHWSFVFAVQSREHKYNLILNTSYSCQLKLNCGVSYMSVD